MYLFLDRGKGREQEKERNINRLALLHNPNGDGTSNPWMCPDWESNQQPFTLWNDAQPREPHQSGPFLVILEREDGGAGGWERNREKPPLAASHTCMPRLGIEPQPFGVRDNAPNNWANWPWVGKVRVFNAVFWRGSHRQVTGLICFGRKNGLKDDSLAFGLWN